MAAQWAAFFPGQAKANSLLDRLGTATRRQMWHSRGVLAARCWGTGELPLVSGWPCARLPQRMLDPGSFPCSSRHRSKLSPLFRDREKAQLPQPFASQAWGFASETFRHIALRTPI
jgi:hypothetical protein